MSHCLIIESVVRNESKDKNRIGSGKMSHKVKNRNDSLIRIKK